MWFVLRFVIPGTAGVPVPSRCFHDKVSPEKPLSGLRVVIKDNIDMAGVPTGVGNRAFGALYGARNENAACVEKLLAAGAVIIGRVKTVQFASGESAKDWFDYQAPFNPRGDGYQDPECSSAGSAVACAAYDWVDIAIGTDSMILQSVPSGQMLTAKLNSNWEHHWSGLPTGIIRITPFAGWLSYGWCFPSLEVCGGLRLDHIINKLVIGS